MVMNINEFIQNFKGGGARSDKFRAIITYPALVGTPDIQDYIVVHVASLPGSTVSPAMVFFQGRQIPLLGDRQLEPFTMTLYNDTTFSHRNAFERWMNLINAHEGNIQATSNYRDLLGTIEVHQLDRDGSTVLKVVKLHNVFPDNISPIDLDYANMDQVEQFTVNFAYTNWSSDTTT